MRRRKEKGHWVKQRERYVDGKKAKSRAGWLSLQNHVYYVTCRKEGDEYVVSFSIAKHYLEEMERAGVKL